MKSEPQFRVIPLIIITDPQGNLLLKRDRNSYYWSLPGGILRPRESVKDCLQREILENYSILLEKVSLLKVLSGPDLIFTDETSLPVAPIYMLFRPTRIRGSLRDRPKDNSELRFFAPWNIRADRIFPPMRKAVSFFTEIYSDEKHPIDWERYPNLID